jgi:hypothetical protein
MIRAGWAHEGKVPIDPSDQVSSVAPSAAFSITPQSYRARRPKWRGRLTAP